MSAASSRRFGAMHLAVPFIAALSWLLWSDAAAVPARPGSRVGENTWQFPHANMPPADTLRGARLLGSVVDAKRKPLEFANVLLLRVADSSMVSTRQTDAQGRFVFTGLSPGTYRVQAQQFGYLDGRSAQVQVAAGTLLPVLPPLVLATRPQQLGEVQVTGRKPVIERQLDRTVINVEQMPSTAGGSAYDVIKSAPGVTVTASDAITMQGKSGVLVLIDDRPVRLSQDALLNMLRNMPAESIEKLEVITTPPAKYEAEGNAGILNLRTKQRQLPGWNTDLTLRGAQGQYSRYSGGVVANVKQKAFELNGSYFLGRTRAFEDITQYSRQRGTGPAEAELQSATRTINTARYHDAKGQLEVKTGPKSSAGVVANLYLLANPALGTGTTRTFAGEQPSDTTLQTLTTLGNDSYNYSVDGYYTTRLDSAGKSIALDANYARFHSNQQQDFTNQPYALALDQPVGSPQQVRSLLDGSTYIKSLKLDVTLPGRIGSLPLFKLETGAKFSQVAARNDFLFQREQNGNWQDDALRTNQFEYDETIYAAYGSVSQEWQKLSVQLGLRGEYTRTLGTSRTTSTSTRNNYFKVFPTVYLQYKFSPAYQLNLSYSRRIGRPAYSSLNPFLSYQSQYFSNQGNPFLQPSFTDEVEWTNVFKNDITVAPFVNYTSGFASEYPVQNPATRETTYTFGNLGYAYNYGLTAVLPFSIGKRWKVDNNLTIYDQHFRSTYEAQPQQRHLLVLDLSVTNSFTITPTLTAQLTGYYNSPTIQGFYQSVSYYALNTGFTLKLWQNKGVVSLSLADLFYTERGAADVHYTKQDFGFYRRNDTRLLRFTFTYKLGNTKLAGKTQRAGAAQEERSRAN